jgi:hypothetical protein
MRSASIVLHDEDAAKPGAVLKSSNVTPSYLVSNHALRTRRL